MHLSPELVIEAHELVRAFGNFRAVDGISFEVHRGEIFGFLGANGAGKTTTIRMLCGLLAPTSGTGRVVSYDIMGESERIKREVGYMSQKFSLYPDLTVEENLDFFGGLYNVFSSRLAERKRWALDLADLSSSRSRITSTLAGGFKQRLALAAALLHEPALLFLDEPTAGVSPEARRLFWDLIHELAASGTTVFVTSHYMDEVEHCDRIAMMSRGKIAALDTPAGLKKNALGGQLVRLETSANAPQLRAAFEAHSSVLDVQPFGDAFHVLMEEKIDGPFVVARAAAAAGIPVSSAVAIEPSLEDVFIAVIARTER